MATPDKVNHSEPDKPYADKPYVHPAEYLEVDPALLVPGSLVFSPTSGPVDPSDVSCAARRRSETMLV
jgi:hypothetical protein